MALGPSRVVEHHCGSMDDAKGRRQAENRRMRDVLLRYGQRAPGAPVEKTPTGMCDTVAQIRKSRRNVMGKERARGSGGSIVLTTTTTTCAAAAADDG